jgi:MFS family permease
VNAIQTLRTQRSNSTTTLLFAVCLAQFMVILDVAIVNVALPAMHDSLHFSTTGLQWVVNAYTLTFAGFLMLGGRSADLLGRRRVFIAGTALFALSSLACALADSRGLLIGARALQGFAGAVVSPATLSIITSSLPEGPERNRGLAAWGAVGGLGASSGALLGGLLTQGFGWPAIFAVNVVIGAVVIALALRFIPAAVRPVARADGPLGIRPRPFGPGSSHPARHFDVTGAVLVTGGLVALTFGIVRTDTLGWDSTGVLVPIAVAVALLAAFAYVEARVAQAPLVPLSIFRVGQLRAANLVVVLLYAAQFPGWFFLTLYMQQVLHYDAIEAGLGFLPMTLSIFAVSSQAPKIVARFGPRRVIVAGMSVGAAGMLTLTGVAPDGSYLSSVLVGAVLSALGMGLSLVPSTIVSMQGVPRQQSGLASGLLNTSRLVGGALGLAVLSTIAASRTRGDIGAGAAQALTNGFGVAFLIAALFLVAGAAVALFFLRAPAATDEVPVADESREAIGSEVDDRAEALAA